MFAHAWLLKRTEIHRRQGICTTRSRCTQLSIPHVAYRTLYSMYDSHCCLLRTRCDWFVVGLSLSEHMTTSWDQLALSIGNNNLNYMFHHLNSVVERAGMYDCPYRSVMYAPVAQCVERLWSESYQCLYAHVVAGKQPGQKHTSTAEILGICGCTTCFNIMRVFIQCIN